MKRLVIDASVAMKWYFSDEEHGEKALKILEAHASDRLSLLAPALLEFEMANVMVVAKRRGRVKDEDTIGAMEGFTGLGISFYPMDSLFKKILGYCHVNGISAYDAAYIALAEDLKTDFVTADKRLFNSTRKLTFVTWIGDLKTGL